MKNKKIYGSQPNKTLNYILFFYYILQQTFYIFVCVKQNNLPILLKF